MTTFTNRYGEQQTDWQSHKHPENPDFMQVVKYMHIQYTDGRNHLHWSLQGSATNDKHVIYNITLSEAKAKYMDAEVSELDEVAFQEWLANKK